MSDAKGPFKETPMYADILLPVKLGDCMPRLTYSVPKDLKVSVGQAVRVSLRNRTITGIVTELHERSLNFTAKEILTAKEGGRTLEPWQIDLAEWITYHTMAPFHKVLKMLLPKKLWREKNHIPYQIAYERTEQSIPKKLGGKPHELIKLFEHKKILLREEIKGFSQSSLRGLETKGLLRKVQSDIRGTQTETMNPYHEKKLTHEQQTIVHQILNTNEKKFLIHGVTGSGKT